MARDTATFLEAWDLTLPPLLPRSRLYRLEPMGIGTPYVESLTSYIARLAEAHCVSIMRIIGPELGPAVATSKVLANVRRRGSLGPYTKLINGTGVPAMEWVQALETLTLRSDLRFLTMRTLTSVLSPNGLLHPIRAWCPACYQEWDATGQIIYEPLLWMLACVQICPRHGRRLSFVCPHCDRQSSLLARSARPGYCLQCGQWLGIHADRVTSESDQPNDEELKPQKRRVDAVAKMLAAAPAFSSPPSKEMLLRAISTGRDQIAQGNRSKFAGLVQTYDAEVWAWETGKSLPTLSKLLRIVCALGLSVSDFLTGAYEAPNPDRFIVFLPSRSNSKLAAPFHKKAFDFDVARQTLEAALDHEDPPPTIWELTRRLGYPRGSLERFLPDLCRALINRSEERKQFYLSRAEQILRATLDETPPPSLCEIARRHNIALRTLKRRLPDLCRLIIARRAANQEEYYDQIRNELQRARQEYPPPSVHALAQRLGYKNRAGLYNNFYDLCVALAARHGDYQKARHAEARRKSEEEIAQMARDLIAKGEYPSIQRIREVLGKTPGHLPATMRKVRRELDLS